MSWDNATDLDSEAVKNLVELASRSRLACVVYKKPAENPTPRRYVEPYKFLESSENLLVRCYQVRVEGRKKDDAEGWRSFRLDRFISVSDGGENFSPRGTVSLHRGEVFQYIFNHDKLREPVPRNIKKKLEVKMTPRKYARHIDSVLLDGKITDAELEQAMKYAKMLSADELKLVHAKVYIGVLREVTLDGTVNEAEEAYMASVRIFLTGLGWCP